MMRAMIDYFAPLRHALRRCASAGRYAIATMIESAAMPLQMPLTRDSAATQRASLLFARYATRQPDAAITMLSARCCHDAIFALMLHDMPPSS